MGDRPSVEQEQVVHFRLHAHNLASRLPRGRLLEAVAACGIRNTPPWIAPHSLLARVADLQPDDLDGAALTNRTLTQTWSLRLVACFAPSADLATFTTALWPQDESAALSRLPKIAGGLARLGMPALEALERTAAIMRRALPGTMMSKGELSTIVSRELPDELTPWCDSCRTNHVDEALFCMAAYQRVFCFGPRLGNQVQYVLVDEWLGPQPKADPLSACTELLRRYLRCCGPSTAAEFAEWSGMAPADGERAWRRLEPELAEVSLGRRTCWLLHEDLPALLSPPPPAGVRLLPPSDPFLLLRDRETLVPDRATRQRVWRAVGSPGLAVAAGRPVATWRVQQRGKRLQLTIEPIAPLPRSVLADLQSEADLTALQRGCTAATVTVAQ